MPVSVFVGALFSSVMVDPAGTGEIDLGELRHVLLRLGEKMSGEEFEEVFGTSAVGTSGSGSGSAAPGSAASMRTSVRQHGDPTRMSRMLNYNDFVRNCMLQC